MKLLYSAGWMLLTGIIFSISIGSVASAKTSSLRYDQIYSFTSSTAEAGLEDSDPAGTQAPPVEQADIYYRAKVIKILEEGTQKIDGQTQEYQKVELEILNGNEKGQHITIDNGRDYIVGIFQKVIAGETVVVAKPASSLDGRPAIYYIVDRYRNPALGIIACIFFALAIYFGRRRGLTSIIGMLFSVLIIFYYIIPHISKGGNPLLTCVIGSILILLLSLYLSHGFNKRTSVALLSTLIAFGAAILIDLLFVYMAKLAGNGTEEAFYLQFDNVPINLRGLLLGGIIIGVLGVLDDVTTGQAAAVEEIFAANSALNFRQLYNSGLSVGREHIASLINTLVLAYVGASFPLLLLYSSNKMQPLWVTLNSNFIAEEIVRALVGSAALVIAVPLTTFLAAYFCTQSSLKKRRASFNNGDLPSREQLLEQWWKKE